MQIACFSWTKLVVRGVVEDIPSFTPDVIQFIGNLSLILNGDFATVRASRSNLDSFGSPSKS